jgi:nicotinamide-nucleotide amidase
MTDLTPLLPLATELIASCTNRKLKIATAESCTGGLIAGVLTEVPGSSSVVDRGFVTYSNNAKTGVLGVPAALIENVGAVSEEVARAMVAGAITRSIADLAVAVTGIAGPGGGTRDKPVGLVHMAVLRRSTTARHSVHNFGNIGRSAVRIATVHEALTMLLQIVQER